MPERLVISNTTPLLYLHRIRLLALLPRLYGQIHVPPAVVAELATGRARGCDVPITEQYDWLRLRPLSADQPLFHVHDLGDGEAEVLALATRTPGCLVLMDDALGRQLARLNGITLTGTAGVLLRAKRERLIPSLQEALAELVGAGFWLDEDTMSLLLKRAGER
jgi:predicted nucleic acid-binding protein